MRRSIINNWSANLLAALAILLRLASDWMFPEGGPLAFQILQATILAMALFFLWPRFEAVYLRGGNTAQAVKIGLLGIPLGLLFGIGDAALSGGGLELPAVRVLLYTSLGNLFFSAVEELEFRGFLLSWVGGRRVATLVPLLIVSAVATLAHSHRFWPIDPRAIIITFAVNVWWTWIVLRTHSLWGAWIAHVSWNICVLLPVLGSSNAIR